MIRLEGLTKHYGSFVALDHIALHVPRGVLYGCLGPNGAGKTTMLRMIAGILRPTDGRVLIGGDDVQVNPVAELLEVFELSSWKDELIEAYSHGMRQKLIISSALIHRPECIVVDEPMVGLDPKGARLLKDIFRQFVERGGTVLMSTHTLEVAEAMCDQIGILQHGRIVAHGTMAEIRRQHAAGDASLEELFLKLTGGHAVRELVEVLGR
jgi:ABC-2 type transport system ATP-binding protein